jgi:hypothetical protein
MKILYTVAVLSFLALVWAAYAISRHIRANSAKTAQDLVQDPELAEAISRRLSSFARPPAPDEKADSTPAPPIAELEEFSGVSGSPAAGHPMLHSDGPVYPASANHSSRAS